MTEKSPQATNIFCKYDEYFHPQIKRNPSQMKYTSYVKKFVHKKNRHASIFNTSFPNDSIQNFHEITLTHTRKISDQRNSSLKQNTQTKNQKMKKIQDLKLQKLFPKSVTIKFEDVLNSIPNNKLRQKFNSKNFRKNLTVSPFKIFQMIQNKYYQDFMHESKKYQKKIKQNEKNSNNVTSIFNVKSIKMLKKKTQESLNNDQDSMKKIRNSPVRKSKKYDRKMKNKTQIPIFLRKDEDQVTEQKQNQNQQEFIQKDLILKSSQRKSLKNSLFQEKSLDGNQIATKQRCSNRSPTLLMSKKTKSKQMSPNSSSLFQKNSSFYSQFSSFDNQYQGNTIFQEKMFKYTTMLLKNAQLYDLKIEFPTSYSRNQFNFYVGYGNNSKLVKQTLKKRWWLGSCEEKKDLHKNNVIWTQLKDKAYYVLNQKEPADQIDQNIVPKKIIHNHFEQNQFLGNKKALYYNMKAYYESIGQNVFKYLPLTLHIKSLQDDTWKEFLGHFERFQNQDPDGKNIWILKPGQNSNRGNGITVHKSVQSIKSAVTQNQKEGRTFILQKYIEKPFLYQRRKFDIRCYMLLTRLNGEIKGFWYKQGYIRTSGHEYTLQDCQNSYIHLTNDAIQQHCDTYGKYQDKNKLSYESFQKYLDENFNTTQQIKKYDLERDILPKLRKVCIDSIRASYKCLGKWRQGLPTFELFGLDFMIDNDFEPWLIEINTNPCLETQGRVLQKVIVPLIDNVFKLSIDCIFPPPKNWSNSYKHLISKNVNINYFELVFQQKEMNDCQAKKDQLEIEKIGQIQQDDEVYQQNE